MAGRIRHADPERADEVLVALAEASAPDGGDDVERDGALAWLLLPGACRMASMLSRYSARIDEVVAAQLWIEARGVNWRTGRAVAANGLMNTRKGVLRDLGIPSRHQSGWAWSLVTLVDQMDLVPSSRASLAGLEQ